MSHYPGRLFPLLVSILMTPLLGCRGSLPSAPSDLTQGIVVYEHADFLGGSAHIIEDIKDLKDFRGPCLGFEASGTGVDPVDNWNDCISSVRVAPGWRVFLYRDDDFDGDQLQVVEDIRNLQFAAGRCDKGGFNDCTTSIRLLRP